MDWEENCNRKLVRWTCLNGHGENWETRNDKKTKQKKKKKKTGNGPSGHGNGAVAVIMLLPRR